MNIQLLLSLIAVPLFIISVCAYIFIKLNLKSKPDPDDFSWEFEDENPAAENYNKFSQFAFIGVIISMLLLSLALIF